MNVTTTFFLALVVVSGSFAYMLLRGGGDPVIMPVIAASLGMVLSYFFAHQLSNGAATSALNTLVESNRATASALDHSNTAAASALARSNTAAQIALDHVAVQTASTTPPPDTAQKRAQLQAELDALPK